MKSESKVRAKTLSLCERSARHERSECEPDRAKQVINGAPGEGLNCDKSCDPHPTLSQRERDLFVT
jgi:hypothetical protein